MPQERQPNNPGRSDSEEFEAFLRNAEETRKKMSKARWLIFPIVSGIASAIAAAMLAYLLFWVGR